jgi:hypothetical protein
MAKCPFSTRDLLLPLLEHEVEFIMVGRVCALLQRSVSPLLRLTLEAKCTS